MVTPNSTEKLYSFFSSTNFYYKQYTINKRHTWFEIKWWNKELQSEQISSNKLQSKCELPYKIKKEANIKYSNCTYIEKLEEESPNEWVIYVSSEKRIIEIKWDRLKNELNLVDILFHKDFDKEYDLNLINFCWSQKHILESLEWALNIPEQQIHEFKLENILQSMKDHVWDKNYKFDDQKIKAIKLKSNYNSIRSKPFDKLKAEKEKQLSWINEDDRLYVINPKAIVTVCFEYWMKIKFTPFI